MGKAECHGVLPRGLWWKKQDVMVYCQDVGGGKGNKMPWCTVQRLEVGKAGCHGVCMHIILSREVGKEGYRCHGVLSRGCNWRWE